MEIMCERRRSLLREIQGATYGRRVSLMQDVNGNPKLLPREDWMFVPWGANLWLRILRVLEKVGFVRLIDRMC